MKEMKRALWLIMSLSAFSYSPQAAPTNGTYSNGVATPNDLSAEMKTFYEMTLLEDAQANLVHGQFGEKKPIPANAGKTIEFRKFNDLPDATTPLTEGVTPDGSAMNVTTITATISEYGDFVPYTELLDLTSIDPFLAEATKKLAQQAASTLDTVDRNALVAGTNVSYASKWSGTTETAVSARSGLDMTAILKVDTIMQAVAKLKAQNAPTVDGNSYVAIIHPYVSYDLRRDPEWTDAHKYAQPAELFKGEIGMIAGVRFIESTKAKIWKDTTCPFVNGASGTRASVFATLVLGAGAYAVTELQGGGLEMIVKQKGSSGTSDPLNQRATVGWKARRVTEILHENYMVRIESVSPKYSAAATAN